MQLRGIPLRNLFVALLSVTFIVTACGGATEAEPTAVLDNNTADQAVQNTAVPEVVATEVPPTVADTGNATTDEEPIAARVNGEAITVARLDREFLRLSSASNAADPTALRAQALNILIEQQLINQGAASLGVSVTDEEVQAEIDTLKAIANDLEQDWSAFLRDNNYTEAEMPAVQRDSLITQRVRDVLLAPYSGNVEQAHARHILVRTQEDAQTVLNRLNAGEDFAIVASELSIDATTKDFGGDLGWFTRDELIDATLAETIFQLAPGAIEGPITTQIGYHIVQTIELATRPIEPERLPFLAESVYNNWLLEQYNAATIERF